MSIDVLWVYICLIMLYHYWRCYCNPRSPNTWLQVFPRRVGWSSTQKEIILRADTPKSHFDYPAFRDISVQQTLVSLCIGVPRKTIWVIFPSSPLFLLNFPRLDVTNPSHFAMRTTSAQASALLQQRHRSPSKDAQSDLKGIPSGND